MKNKFKQSEVIHYEMPDFLNFNDSIDILDFPVRTTNALKKNKIETIGQLISFPENKLSKIKMIGIKVCNAVEEIKEKIELDYNMPREKFISVIDTDYQQYKAETPLNEIGFPQKITNLLEKNNIKTIGELFNFPEWKIVRVSNKNQDTKEILIEIKRKPAESEIIKKTMENKDFTVDEMVDIFFKKCGDERSKKIIFQRYGIDDGERHTLEEIGNGYNITRERVRQIQVKTLKKLKTYQYSRILSKKIEDLIYQNGGIISDERADKIFRTFFNKIQIDGSNFLDLLSDLKWIQQYQIGDIRMYSPIFDKISIEKISNIIFSTISNNEFGIEFNDLVNRTTILDNIYDERFNKKELILSYCLIDPRIEEYDNFQLSGENKKEEELIFRIPVQHNQITQKWSRLLVSVLEEENEPMHFTEITYRVNDKLPDFDQKIDVRRVHGILINDSEFAHSGVKGTWGLAKWGIRKESTTELVVECLKKAGFPLHWKQIYSYVSKYKDTKPANIMSLLHTRPEFEHKNRGTFGLLENINGNN